MSRMIVCYGDSNTHGYNGQTGGRFSEDARYPCVLQRMLGDDYLVREEGLSGRTTVFDDPLYEGMSGISTIYPILMSHEPIDLLIIMLGTNDIKERFHCNAENIAVGMERLVRKAIHTPDAFTDLTPNILVIAPPPIEDGYEQVADVCRNMGKGCLEKSRILPKFYKEMTQRVGVHFLDAGLIPGVIVNDIDFRLI